MPAFRAFQGARVKLLKAPLLHFMIAGALLFGGYEWMNRGTPTSQPEGAVRIGEGEILWLRQTFTNQWRRDQRRRR